MRPLLALDTSSDHLALALGDLDAPGAVLAATDFAAPHAANTVVAAAAERLLSDAGIEPAALAAIAIGRGPGSFTGVRIGVATAKGLAHGLRVPLAGFSTLDAIAHRAAEEGLLGVVADAMRQEVYPALFRIHAGCVHRLSADRVARPAEVAAEWAELDEAIALTGGGLAKHRAAFESAVGSHTRVLPERLWVPDGPSLLAAAWAAEGGASLRAVALLDRADAFEAAHPAAMLPIYTRLADAEEAERLRAGAGSELPQAGVAGPPIGASR
jgi:N6-L-threonylcarbamoyladenine synthase